MADKQYEKRDAAAEAYVLYSRSVTPNEVAIERAAFNAGWEARKRTEYEALVERVKDGLSERRTIR